MTNSSCAFFLFLACHRPREQKAKSHDKWSRRERHGCVRQVNLCRLLRLLHHESGTDERTFFVTLVREDPSCPNRGETLLFHCFVLTRGVHVHLSHVLDLNLHCFFTPFGGKRCIRHIVVVHVVVVGYFCMTKFLHCSRFKRLQTTNSSQCLSRSAYHRSRGSTWTNCCVFCSQFVREVLHQSTRETISSHKGICVLLG